MKILYVTSTWTPLLPALYERAESINGMPGFWRPLKALVDNGHEVDMLLYDTFCENENRTYSIALPWLQRVNIVGHIHVMQEAGVKKLYSTWKMYRQIKSATFKQLKMSQYNFVYGHGPFSEAANSLCKKYGVPFGLRQYGDSLQNIIELKGRFYAMLSRPVNFISYKSKKAFLLATNDGSKVDVTVSECNHGKDPPYCFQFWINGVDRTTEGIDGKLPCSGPYLLYSARIVDWKRQERAIDLLYHLAKAKIPIQLLIAGPIDSEEYYQKLLAQIKSYGLTESVTFLGSQTQKQLFRLASHATACLSFYDISNFGNSLIEYLMAGGAVITLNDGSTSATITSGENGFLIDQIEDGVDIVRILVENPQFRETIQHNARKQADKQFQTWEARVQKELDLIERYARK